MKHYIIRKLATKNSRAIYSFSWLCGNRGYSSGIESWSMTIIVSGRIRIWKRLIRARFNLN